MSIRYSEQQHNTENSQNTCIGMVCMNVCNLMSVCVCVSI